MRNTSIYSVEYSNVREICLQSYALRPIIDTLLQIEDVSFNNNFLHDHYSYKDNIIRYFIRLFEIFIL